MIDYPRISFSVDDLKRGKVFSEPEKYIFYPIRKIPKRVCYESERYYIVGYFLSYDLAFGIEKLVTFLEQEMLADLMKFAADYWITIVDKEKKLIYSLIDPFSKFSVYYSKNNKDCLISMDLPWIVSRMSTKRIDIGGTLDFVSGLDTQAMDQRTPIKGVYRMPPGTLLSMDESGFWKIQTYINVDNLFERLEDKIPISDFGVFFVNELSKSVLARLNSLNDVNIYTDISGGFDSSLVSYILSKYVPNIKSFCWIPSDPALRDTDPSVLKKFCDKHSIDMHIHNPDEMYSLSDKDIDWTAFRLYPGSHAFELEFNHCNWISNSGKKSTAVFQGHGGDETYYANILEEDIRFYIQKSYFWIKNVINKYKLGLIFSKDGKAELLNETRFSNRLFFPPMVAPSASYLYTNYSCIYWETNTWPLTPFLDFKVFQASRKLFCGDGRNLLSKQDVWKLSSEDIFVPEQFVPKRDLTDLFRKFVVNRRKKVIEILEKSVLSTSGLFNTKRIIEDLRSGNFKEYLRDGVFNMLESLIHAEIFFQKNGFSI